MKMGFPGKPGPHAAARTSYSCGLAMMASMSPYSMASCGDMKKSRSVSRVMVSMLWPVNWACVAKGRAGGRRVRVLSSICSQGRRQANPTGQTPPLLLSGGSAAGTARPSQL